MKLPLLAFVALTVVLFMGGSHAKSARQWASAFNAVPEEYRLAALSFVPRFMGDALLEGGAYEPEFSALLMTRHFSQDEDEFYRAASLLPDSQQTKLEAQLDMYLDMILSTPTTQRELAERHCEHMANREEREASYAEQAAAVQCDLDRDDESEADTAFRATQCMLLAHNQVQLAHMKRAARSVYPSGCPSQ